MAIRTLYLPSVPLYLTLHPLYLCHETHGISYTTPTLCTTSQTIHGTSYSVCMLSQQLLRTLHTYMYNFTPSIFMTSYSICMLSPYRFHENTMTIPGILTPYLTSQPLYPCHHRDGTHMCIGISLYWWHHNKCVSLHTWHTSLSQSLNELSFTLSVMNMKKIYIKIFVFEYVWSCPSFFSSFC